MAREKEIKIQLKDLSTDAFVSRIRKKGFVLQKILPQEDIYFDTKDWYLYENLAALRIRKIKDTFDSFSFKKVFYIAEKIDHYYIEELEVTFPITDLDVLNQILKKIELNFDDSCMESGVSLTSFLRNHGYQDEQHLRKIRYLYVKEDNEIVIDDVDDVGTIIELECNVDEPMKYVNSFLDPEEWTRSTEGTSYLWLTKHKGFISHRSNLKRFESDVSWNVWKHEEMFYHHLQ